MAVRKTTTKRKTTRKPAARRKTTTRRGSNKTAPNFVNFFVPFFFIVCILFCLGFLGFMGYRTVTASEFFDVKAIDIRGGDNVKSENVEKLVRAETEKTGVWKADLSAVKVEVEKITVVKSATVSRVLPDGIRVDITERVPKAVVRIDGGDFWADEDGIVLGEVDKSKPYPSFVIYGWERDKSERAQENNKDRVKMYSEMMEDWRELELDRRVLAIDFDDIKEPRAIVKDSDEMVYVTLKPSDFGNVLKEGLKYIAGKGDKAKGVFWVGSSPRLEFREQKN